MLPHKIEENPSLFTASNNVPPPHELFGQEEGLW